MWIVSPFVVLQHWRNFQIVLKCMVLTLIKGCVGSWLVLLQRNNVSTKLFLIISVDFGRVSKPISKNRRRTRSSLRHTVVLATHNHQVEYDIILQTINACFVLETNTYCARDEHFLRCMETNTFRPWKQTLQCSCWRPTHWKRVFELQPHTNLPATCKLNLRRDDC